MSAQTEVVCLVIVAESVLEARLLDGIAACGARGWTVTAARGQGPRNRRTNEVEGGNTRIETLVSEAVAERVWELLDREYFPHYAVAAWASAVRVARGERYG